MRLSIIAWVAGLLLVEGVALGAPVVVVPFDGAKKKSVRTHVVSALQEDGVEVVVAGSPNGDGDDAYRELAEKHEATAVVTAETTMGKKGWKTVIVVRSGKDGAVLGEAAIKGAWLPGLLKEIDGTVAGALAPALARASEQVADAVEPAADAPEPEPLPEHSIAPEEDRPAPEEDEADGAQVERLPTAVRVRLGARVFQRDFSYSQDINGNLRPYSTDPTPAGVASVEWYPGAHFTSSPLADIGIVGGFERSIGATSDLEGGDESFATAMQSFDVGLRYRLRLAEHEIGISARYAGHSFQVEGDADPAATSAAGTPLERDYMPDVSYAVIRPGLDLRLAFGDAIVGLHGGYRVVQSMGDLQGDAWFPDATAGGVDAGLFGGCQIAGGFGALVGVDVARYGLDMQSRPDDLADGRDVAGGAVDQYLSGWVAVEWAPAGG